MVLPNVLILEPLWSCTLPGSTSMTSPCTSSFPSRTFRTSSTTTTGRTYPRSSNLLTEQCSTPAGCGFRSTNWHGQSCAWLLDKIHLEWDLRKYTNHLQGSLMSSQKVVFADNFEKGLHVSLLHQQTNVWLHILQCDPQYGWDVNIDMVEARMDRWHLSNEFFRRHQRGEMGSSSNCEVGGIVVWFSASVTKGGR